MCLEVLQNCAYKVQCTRVWCVYICDCEIFVVNFSFNKDVVTSSSQLISFKLKSILSDIRIATPACFLVPFSWYILFPSFHLKIMSFLKGEMDFL